jgi:hypothetical protein
MDISAVGRGTAMLDGSGFTDQPGRFQINGGTWQSMPDTATRYTLGVSTQQTSTTTEKPPGPVVPHGQ